MNNQQKEQHAGEQEVFPYKTYDEILMEKERRLRFRRAMVFMAGIFLMLCAVLIGISMVWNRSTNPLDLLRREDPGRDQTGDPALPQNETAQPKDFSLASAPIPSRSAQPEGSGSIYVADVSGLIQNARAFVVSIEAESYGVQLTSRSGSGVILSEDGYILTEAQILTGCDSISVTLSGGESYAAFVIGSDSCSGIAVLKVDAQGLTAAQLGDSDKVEIGQAVVAMGSTAGTTFGIISGVDMAVEKDRSTQLHLLQTSASVNAGNSGGPLLNQYGQVIGLNIAGLSLEGYEGMSFALPINQVRPIAEQLVSQGSVSSSPMLGVTGKRLSAMAASFYRLPQGILLTDVDPDGGAGAAGLQAGDVITHLDGVRVLTVRGAAERCRQYSVGSQISVTYYRRGVTTTIQVSLTDQQKLDRGGNF